MKRFILDQYRLFIAQSLWMKVLYSVLAFFVIITSFRAGDIDFFIETGQRFLDNKDLYRELYNGSIYFVYSPVFSFLISPFTFLPIILVRFLWAAANIYFVFEICRIVLSYLPQNEFLQSHKVKILFISILFTIHFFNLNFIIGQMTVCMLYLCVKAIYENDKGNIWGASFLLAIGILIKVMPIIILVYFIYNRNFKAFFATIFLIEILFFLPFIFVSYADMVSHYLSWCDAIINSGGGFEREYSPSMHSLHSLSIVYFTSYPDILDQSGLLPFHRIIASFPYEYAKYISYSLSAILIILTLKILNRMPFTEPKSKFHILYEFGYLCLITPLIFPMQQKYGYIFIFPAIVYLLYSVFVLRSENQKADIRLYICYVCMALCFIFTSLSTIDAILGETIKEISQYYKLIVWGAVIALIPYMLLTPRLIQKLSEK
jgi:hypothetical protein